MCDEQAYLKFHREFEGSYTVTKYLSHVDPKANVCYVMFVGDGHLVGSPDQDKSFVSAEVKDAFEGTVYGELFGRICPDCKPSECHVIPRGSDTNLACDRSADLLGQSRQFYGLVRKYFGVKM